MILMTEVALVSLLVFFIVLKIIEIKKAKDSDDNI